MPVPKTPLLHEPRELQTRPVESLGHVLLHDGPHLSEGQLRHALPVCEQSAPQKLFVQTQPLTHVPWPLQSTPFEPVAQWLVQAEPP